MDTDEFGKQFSLMRTKALKYDNMSSRYVDIAKKIKKVSEELELISKEIDPFLNVKKGEEGNTIRGSFMEVAKEVYEKCIAGTEISRKFLEATYPGYALHQYGYILQLIETMPNIAKRKEKGFVHLYAKGDTFREKMSNESKKR